MILVIDTHFLCHRAFHSQMNNLAWKHRPTGVMFGFLRSVKELSNQFGANSIAFCFEHPHLFRRDISPGYKKRRTNKEKTPEEVKASQELHRQIDLLRTKYLPEIGYKNIIQEYGYESDDTMASIARDYDDVVIVTADKDLYQCLFPGVTLYNPVTRVTTTHRTFSKQYKIRPSQWAIMKAISGCKSDEVKGITGVGEITALKFLRGELPEGHRLRNAILSSQGRATVRRNRALVELPYKGCPAFQIKPDAIRNQDWIKVVKSLGMRSLI